jgi:hypothetical protein
MKTQVLEVEADSLEEAYSQAQAKVPEGLTILSREILSDGKQHSCKGSGETTEAALAEARSNVPEAAAIVQETELQAPRYSVLEIQAFDEETARIQAKTEIEEGARIEKLEVKSEGKRGFLGIGKQPNTYGVHVFHPAVAEVVFQQKARIRVKFGVDPQIERLIGKLGGGPERNPNMVRESALALAKIGKLAVPALIEALEQGDEFAAEGAVLALRRIGPDAKAAVPALMKGLDHRDEYVRGICAIALGSIEPESMRSVAALVMALGSNVYSVRQGVIKTLLDMRDMAVPALIEATKHPDHYVREGSLQALKSITGDKPDDWSQWWNTNRDRYTDVADKWQEWYDDNALFLQQKERGDDILERSYDLRVKPASEYRKGEKIIFTFGAQFGPKPVSPGTETIVEDIVPQRDPKGYGSIKCSLPALGTVTVSAEKVDSVENGMGEMFRNLGAWIPCRKVEVNDDEGWFIQTGYYVRARLIDGRILEGRISKIVGSLRAAVKMTIGEIEVTSNQITNLIWKQ